MTDEPDKIVRIFPTAEVSPEAARRSGQRLNQFISDAMSRAADTVANDRAKQAADAKSYLNTLREAFARELECMARGYVAHEHLIIKQVYDKLRELPLEDEYGKLISPFLFFSQHVVMTLMSVRNAPQNAYYQYWDHPSGLLAKMLERLCDIDPLDPMKPFSDNARWWPREFPVIPDWVATALEEITEVYDKRERDGGEGLRPPARQAYRSHTEGMREARDIIYKHMPAQPLAPDPIIDPNFRVY
jgi:hypothetical protein